MINATGPTVVQGDVVKWFNTEVCKTSIHRFESGRRLHSLSTKRPAERSAGPPITLGFRNQPQYPSIPGWTGKTLDRLGIEPDLQDCSADAFTLPPDRIAAILEDLGDRIGAIHQAEVDALDMTAHAIGR